MLDDREGETASRAELLPALLSALVQGSLTPVSVSELVGLAERVLAEALADVEGWELREVVLGLDEDPAIAVDGAGRLHARAMPRSPLETLGPRGIAEDTALRVAATDPPAEPRSGLGFGAEVFTAPLLDPLEEQRLGLQARGGDYAAIRKLVEANTRLVWALATRAGGTTTPALGLEDLFQEGCLGAFRAAEKFDPSRGFRFSTYATWWIRQALDRAYAAKARTIRYPVHIEQDLRRLSAAEQALASAGQRATAATLAARVENLTQDDIRRLQDLRSKVLSIEETPEVHMAEDESDWNPDGWLRREAVHQVVRSVFARLNRQEADVVRHRLGFGSLPAGSLRGVAEAVGLSAEGVRKIETRVYRTARSQMRMNPLE